MILTTLPILERTDRKMAEKTIKESRVLYQILSELDGIYKRLSSPALQAQISGLRMELHYAREDRRDEDALIIGETLRALNEELERRNK